jgi:hypothetical protein
VHAGFKFLFATETKWAIVVTHATRFLETFAEVAEEHLKQAG